VKSFLTGLEEKIENSISEFAFTNIGDETEFQSTFVPAIGDRLYSIWIPFHDELRDIFATLNKDECKEGFQFFRSEMKNLVYQSPFAKRSMEKPRGYAGDFEMMNLIYRNANYGQTLFGKCMENAFLRHPEPQAVRNRINYLSEKIVSTVLNKQGATIFSVGLL
jgi:hypothetical protein